MLQKQITYIDYNGNERKETHEFNLSRAEIIKMNFKTQGGMIAFINKIIEAQDMPTLMDTFEDFILKSYGRTSPDGKRFEKDPQMTLEFTQTEAYSELLTELCSDAEAAVKFFEGIIPAENPKKSSIPAPDNK